MIANSVQEEAKLDAMLRVWQTPNRRLASTLSVFKETPDLEEFCPLPTQNSCSAIGRAIFKPSPSTLTYSDVDSENEKELLQEVECEALVTSKKPTSYTVLDASELGDIPAVYKISPVHPYQLPAVGVYIDKRITPGFKYKVRPLPPLTKPNLTLPYLFNGRGLTLNSIGRGYARRFNFESDKDRNDNYFWSDNRPDGVAFELEAISEGDKFTIFDMDHVDQGTAEVLRVEAPQNEISHTVSSDGIEKKVKVKFIAKVEFYETGVAKPMPLNGVVICVKRKNSPTAEITKVISVNIKHHRYYFTPGYQKNQRRVTVKGEDINDVPTKYTMTGLQPYEIPVVGTYVDPRVIAGFSYKVRPNDRKEHLFGGRALRLVSIGMGYAKRLTFEPDSLINPDNYLWSDSHPDGLGLMPWAVQKGMRFLVIADDQNIGEALVFRADSPQEEEKMEKVLTTSGKYAIVKHIHVNVICHLNLTMNDRSQEYMMGVYGLAIVRKEPNSNQAKIVRLDNVAFDSQLNVLFARNNTSVSFVPL